MTGYSAPQVQRAVLARLKAHAALTAATGERVYDTAPTDAKFPCVAINQIEVTADDTSDVDGASVLLTLSVFTVGVRSRVEAQEILAHVIDAMSDRAAPLALLGFTAWQCRFVSSVVFRTEEQRGGAHGVARFNIRTHA